MKTKPATSRPIPFAYLLIVLLVNVLFSACDKKENGPQTSVRYALTSVTGASPSRTTYLQGLNDLNISTVDNNNAIEMPNAATMWTYKNAVYMVPFGAPASLVKYTFTPEGKAVEEEKIIVPGANTFSTVHFISATEAYASVAGGLFKIIKFDPTTMRILAEINLASIQRKDATAMYFLGMVERGSKLFVGVHYEKNFTPLYDSAHVAVLDMPTGKIEKLMSSPKTAMIFASGSSVNSFVKDANGDIYVIGMGTKNVPSGILRIKNNETDFDPTYFFDLKASTGKDCYSLYHFGNGLTFTTRVEDATKFWSQPVCKFYRLDLAKQTSLGEVAGVPAVQGSFTSLMRKFDEETILFNVAAANEDAIYQYSISSGTVSKKFDVVGRCTGLSKLE